MSVCVGKYVLATVKDPQIRSIFQLSLEISEMHLKKIKEFFHKEKFPVPNGFCITTLAFNEFIKNIKNENVFIDLQNTNFDDLINIDKISFNIRKLITSKFIDENLENEIDIALNKIGKEKFYAVRSSATAEDLENMSFAGQQDTYLNIQGINAIKESQVFLIDANASSRPSQNVVKALKEMATAVYPENFK